MKRILVVMLCLAVMCTGAWGEYYDEGNDGSSWETAYNIASKEDLTLMRDRINTGSEDVDKYYKLSVNIDLTSTTYSKRWNSIGNFMGHFDGQNHIIQLDSNGLFSAISADKGTIAVRNLKIVGSVNQAGLTYALHSGIIENCEFQGILKETGGPSHIGCLVANMHGGNIKNCTVSADISFPDDYHYYNGALHGVGSIVGRMEKGTIENCIVHAKMKITARAYITGGIAGYCAGTIDNCTVKNETNIITSGENNVAGGIVGYFMAGIINKCLVEAKTNIITLSNRTYGDNVSGATAGGIVGQAVPIDAETLSITNCTVETGINIMASRDIGGIAGHDGSNDSDSVKLTLLGNTYPSIYPAIGNKSDINPAPSPTTNYYDRGNNGESWETAYILTSPADLILMRNRVNNGTESNGKYYKLGADIDISSETDWTPIGYSSGGSRSFNGNFDGQNHTLTVNISTDKAIATLWGYVGSSGTAESTVIRNLNVEGSVKCIHYEAYDGGIPLLGTDTSYASGLVYQLTSGSIENCNFTGTIEVFGTARAYAGGIVRHLRGITDTGVSTNASVKNCTFKGTIKAEVESSLDGSVHVGGIICATDSGIVENCQTLNETTIIVSSRSGEKRYDIGYPAVGGIVGSASFETEISNCTSNANIIGYEYAGGIAGEIEPNCHLFGNSWPSSQYPEVGNGLSNNTPNNDTTDQDENTVVPSPITSQDKISDKLELAVISPVFISDEIIEKLAKNISVDVKEINLLTSADFDPSEPPEPTDAMRKTITSRNSQFMAKMNTIKVSKDGWYVFMVTVSDDLVGTKVGDLRLYGAEASDFTASSFNAAFDLMPIVNGITGSLEISNFFGVKLDTLPKQFLATMFLSASQSLTIYIVKILLLLLGGCDVGFGVIGSGLMIVAGGVFTIKLIKRKRH